MIPVEEFVQWVAKKYNRPVPVVKISESSHKDAVLTQEAQSFVSEKGGIIWIYKNQPTSVLKLAAHEMAHYILGIEKDNDLVDDAAEFLLESWGNTWSRVPSVTTPT